MYIIWMNNNQSRTDWNEMDIRAEVKENRGNKCIPPIMAELNDREGYRNTTKKIREDDTAHLWRRRGEEEGGDESILRGDEEKL